MSFLAVCGGQRLLCNESGTALETLSAITQKVHFFLHLSHDLFICLKDFPHRSTVITLFWGTCDLILPFQLSFPNLINHNLQMKVLSGCSTPAAGGITFPTDKKENPLQRGINSYFIHCIQLLVAISVHCSSALFTRFIFVLCSNKVKTHYYLLENAAVRSA